MFRVSLNGKEAIRTESERMAYEALAFNSLKGGTCTMSEYDEEKEKFQPIHTITRSAAEQHKKRR